MGMREKPRQTHKSMLGKEIDMHRISMQNEMTVAVGNARVNARGDELGPGGKIIRKREELLRDSVNRTESNRKNIDDMDPEGNE